jgi:histidinol-phosphatase (PHP family)
MTVTSYHNHTTWSDGAATVSAMIEGARKSGLDELGIADHYVLTPDSRHVAWSMRTELLADYVAQISQAGENTEGIAVRLGLEVDYFPETIELVRHRLAPYSFDYLIGSVHFVDGFSIDSNARPWEELSQNERDNIWRGYWQRLRAAAETGLFDIAGHFDLPKKFGYFASVDLNREALGALDAIAEAAMAIEINTSGWEKPVREAYPSLFYLKEANRRGIPLIISADGHKSNDLVRHFDRARALAAEAGYTEAVRFHQRRRFPCKF